MHDQEHGSEGHGDCAHGPARHTPDDEHRDHAHHSPGGHGHGNHTAMLSDFGQRLLASAVLTIPILLLSPAFIHMLRLPWRIDSPAVPWVVLVLSTLVYAWGGWPFLRGMATELRRRRAGMMTLVGVATTVAYAYSAAVTFGLPGMDMFWELATLIDIMLLGHWIEMKSVLGASRALEALVQLMPDTAHLLQADGSVRDLPRAALEPGMRVMVRPGERIPTDGAVVAGESSVDEALLTGESVPVRRQTGDRVIGGALNGEGALTVEVQKTGAQTYLAQVIELVRAAQSSRSQTQDLADRAASLLTAAALCAGLLTLGAWLWLGARPAFAVERMVTVMVVACPHALGLAIPLVVAVSTALAARNGLLIRNRAAFERARLLTGVIFDKTGTLTEGRFAIADVIPLGTLGVDDLLRLAAAVESRSEHPVAGAVTASAHARGLAVPAPSGFKALPGRGAEAVVENRAVAVISPGFLAEQGLSTDAPEVRAAAGLGRTAVYVVVDRALAGAIVLADQIKPDARAAVQELHARGIRTMLLTGDTEPVARWVSTELGLDRYQAQVLPHEKASKVEAARLAGERIAMVGDGVNDAPALAAADLGIAIGTGADVAIETADVVLVRSNPRDVVTLLELSRATYARMLQNLWWAAGYNVIAIPLAAGVLLHRGVVLSPAVGAALMSLSTVIVAINARNLRIRHHGADNG